MKKIFHYYASQEFEPHTEPLDKGESEAVTTSMATPQMINHILQTHANGKPPFVVEMDSDVMVRAMYDWDARLIKSPLLSFVINPSPDNLTPFGVIKIQFDDCLVILYHRRCPRFYPAIESFVNGPE